MLVVVDPGARTPVFAQIAAQIAAQVAAGSLATGTRLPAARELAGSLGANVHTVLHAYQQLRDEGVVELRRGRGAVIIGAPADEDVHEAVRRAVAAARDSGLSLPTLLSLIRKEFGE